MNSFSCLLGTLTLVLSLCTVTHGETDIEKIEASLAKWKAAKTQCEGNYSYKVRWSSFAGFGHTTEIMVRNNEVVARKFQSFTNRPRLVAPGQAAQAEGKSWVETKETLGSHKEGAAPKTLDELYVQAQQVATKELPPELKRYVRFDKQGLLLSCFTVDTRIADDAPTNGVQITSIELSNGESKGKDKKVYTAPNGKPFPTHWGAPPRLQTRDLRPLPGGYGRGSSTLAKWIQTNLRKDAANKDKR